MGDGSDVGKEHNIRGMLSPTIVDDMSSGGVYVDSEKEYMCKDLVCYRTEPETKKGKRLRSGGTKISVAVSSSCSVRPSRRSIRLWSKTLTCKEQRRSDNAVKKWCVAYNLPHKKSIIKQISNEDWNKI